MDVRFWELNYLVQVMKNNHPKLVTIYEDYKSELKRLHDQPDRGLAETSSSSSSIYSLYGLDSNEETVTTSNLVLHKREASNASSTTSLDETSPPETDTRKRLGMESTDLPSSEECFRRCETFASITNTDNALAMMYLQETAWNLEVGALALSDYFGSTESTSQRPSEGQSQPGRGSRGRGSRQKSILEFVSTQPVIDLTVSDKEDEEMVSVDGDTSHGGDFATTDLQHAHLFRLLSWNIDGLSSSSVGFRTPEVINLIHSEKFHVVCLQEVIPNTLTLIIEQLGTLYNVFRPPDYQTRGYFPVICVLKHPGLSYVANTFKMTKFSGSVMDRIMLSLDVVLDAPLLLSTNPRAGQWVGQPIRIRILTSHLESCFSFAQERKSQLSYIWNAMQTAVQQFTSDLAADTPFCAILCGDLNVRDKEVSELGGLPAGMVDIWEVCGARREAKNTWDPRRNPNIHLDNPGPGSRKPNSGFRFDRMMLLSSNRTRIGAGIRPVDFELRGLERVPGRSHFPSDHWAILGHFDLENISH
ncbi:hypothetical protein Aperf_G00000085421 [Anoplocephala perfoliata]